MFNLSKYGQFESLPGTAGDTLEQVNEGLQETLDNDGVSTPDPNSDIDLSTLEPNEQHIALLLSAKNAHAQMLQLMDEATANGIDPQGALDVYGKYSRMSEQAQQYDVQSENLDDETRAKVESAASNDMRFAPQLARFEADLREHINFQESIQDQQMMMQQQGFNLKTHKTAQAPPPMPTMQEQPMAPPMAPPMPPPAAPMPEEGGSDFPLQNLGDFMNKFQDRLITDDPQVFGETVNQFIELIQNDELQSTEISSFLRSFWDIEADDSKKIGRVFGELFELLPGQFKAENTELAMASNKPRGIIKFDLSNHVLNNREARIKTSDSKPGLVKTAADQFGQQYLLYGPTEKRICPKLRGKGGGQTGSGDIVSEYICRHHCLDGIVIDDNKTICGEALWRANVMDKYNREYVDADGSIKGGYIEGRFEVNHMVPEENKMRLAPGETRKPRPAEWGSTESRMQAMRKADGKKRGYRPETNTGDPFVWCQDADQNNVEQSQSTRDSREKAMGHQVVERHDISNAPKQAFNMKQFKTAQILDDDPEARARDDAEAKARGDYPSDCCQSCGTPLDEFNHCPKNCHKQASTKTSQMAMPGQMPGDTPNKSGDSCTNCGKQLLTKEDMFKQQNGYLCGNCNQQKMQMQGPGPEVAPPAMAGFNLSRHKTASHTKQANIFEVISSKLGPMMADAYFEGKISEEEIKRAMANPSFAAQLEQRFEGGQPGGGGQSTGSQPMSSTKGFNLKRSQSVRTAVIPDDGYADGGTPYTDEEMDLMEKQEQEKEKKKKDRGKSYSAHVNDGNKQRNWTQAQGGSISPVVEDGASSDRPPFGPKDKKIRNDDHVSRKPAKKKGFNLKSHKTANENSFAIASEKKN